jgi:hypothetical protein
LLDHFFNNDTKYEQLYGVGFREEGDFVLGKYDAKVISGSLELKRKGHVWYNGSHLPIEVTKTIKPLKKDGYEADYKIKNISDVSIDFTLGVEQVFAFSEITPDDMKEIKSKKVWVRKDKNLGVSIKITSSKTCDYWVVPINTVSTSENGYEKTYQGTTAVNVYKFNLDKNGSFSFKIKTEVLKNK